MRHFVMGEIHEKSDLFHEMLINDFLPLFLLW